MATSNTAAPWRRAFLRELGRSGSVARAAEKVGIDRSSAHQLRRRNAAFAASWQRALERARERLGSGEALRLRDDEIVRPSKAGRPCIARPGAGRWNAGRERTFLAVLTATANVRAAAEAAGVSTQAAYNRRKQWPAFAEEWAAALAEGYVRIETLLIRQATATLDPGSREDPRETPEMTVEQAMNLFKLHRASVQGGRPQRYGWRRRLPDIEDVRAEILRKVAAMEKARGK